jgi:hypothetical protein
MAQSFVKTIYSESVFHMILLSLSCTKVEYPYWETLGAKKTSHLVRNGLQVFAFVKIYLGFCFLTHFYILIMVATLFLEQDNENIGKCLQNMDATTLSIHLTSRVTVLSFRQVLFSLPIFSTIFF